MSAARTPPQARAHRRGPRRQHQQGEATNEHQTLAHAPTPPRRIRPDRLARMLSSLRLRMLAALLATSVVTLAVAALALLGPLEQRLREDGVSRVSAAMTASRPLFARALLHGARAPQNRALEHYARMLAARSHGGQVTVLDRKLATLAYAPDLHTSDFSYYAYPVARRTLATGKQVRARKGETLTVAQTFYASHHRYALVVVKRLAYVAAAFKVVRNAFLVAAAAGLAIALLLGIGFASRLLRRLERLRDATRRVERDGLDALLPEDSARDEIGELSRSFAAMSSRLRRQEAVRRAFVATASHELRTPLASLDGMLELLEDDLSEDVLDLQDARIRTEHAREQTRRLSQLATDLLDISRLDSEVQLRREPLELAELSRAVVAEFERIAGKREVRLTVQPTDGACWTTADPGAVARIVRILIDNALRFAPPQSSIDVAPSADAHIAQISVSDEGPGVPAADRDVIFERFTHGSTSSGGFGLGLAIGRELAQRMDGTLTLADPPDGAATLADPPDGAATLADPPSPGACFTLRLPTSDPRGEQP
ncbi:MAG: HAMP domain-containing sensor histidine kinase [Solirubrobacteraceae bacterium]